MNVNTDIQDDSNLRSGWQVALVAVFIAILSLQLSNFGFSPLEAPIAKTFNMNFTQVGLFGGMGGLVGIFMSIPGGLLMKRFGERICMIIGMLVLALGLALVAVASSIGVVFTGRILWQAAFMVVSPVFMGSIMINSPTRLHATFMGVMGSVAAVAAAGGAQFSSFLARHWDWRAGFWGFAIVTLIGLIIYTPIYKESKRAAAPAVDPNAPKPRSAFATPIVWVLALLLFFAGMPGIGLMLLGAPVLVSIYKLPMGSVAGIITLGFVLSIVVSYVAGWAADRTNRAFFLAGILIVFVITELLMTINNLAVAEVAMVIGIAFGFTVPNMCFAISASAMAGREVGPIMGLTSVGMSLGVYLGPQLLGVVKDMTGGFTAGFFMEAVFALIACIIAVSLEFSMRKSRALAS